MNLYIDDDAAEKLLIQLLRREGRDVSVPIENGDSGLADPLHFAQAIANSRVLLTLNYRDFENLHLLIRCASGRHSGLVVVRKDNDSSRDMSTRGIVGANRKLEISGDAIENEYVILNRYR